MSCRVTVQENPCCTVCYIVSLMYFFCALNEAFIRKEIGFEAADEIVMVSMICLAAEQAISWWIMLNHRGCHPATLSHGSKAVNTVSCSVTSESLPPERRITPTHLLKNQLPFLLINCDHLLKSLRCFFLSWPIFNYIHSKTLPAPIYFSSFHFWKCPGWKKGKAGFFGGSCLIVNFLPFFLLHFSKKLVSRVSSDIFTQFWTWKLCINGGVIGWFGLEGGL